VEITTAVEIAPVLSVIVVAVCMHPRTKVKC